MLQNQSISLWTTTLEPHFLAAACSYITMVATMIILAEAIVYIRPVRTQERTEGFVYSITVWLNALLDA